MLGHSSPIVPKKRANDTDEPADGYDHDALGYRIAITFIPATGGLRFSWVSEWIYKRANQIGRAIAEDALFVIPLDQHRGYLDAVFHLRPIFDDNEELLELREPLLLISQMKDIAIVINLGACETEEELADVMHTVVVRTNGASIPLRDWDLPVPTRRPTGRDSRSDKAFAASEALELKPNFMGLGVNLNALIGWLRRSARTGSNVRVLPGEKDRY